MKTMRNLIVSAAGFVVSVLLAVALLSGTSAQSVSGSSEPTGTPAALYLPAVFRVIGLLPTPTPAPVFDHGTWYYLDAQSQTVVPCETVPLGSAPPEIGAARVGGCVEIHLDPGAEWATGSQYHEKWLYTTWLWESLTGPGLDSVGFWLLEGEGKVDVLYEDGTFCQEVQSFDAAANMLLEVDFSNPGSAVAKWGQGAYDTSAGLTDCGPGRSVEPPAPTPTAAPTDVPTPTPAPVDPYTWYTEDGSACFTSDTPDGTPPPPSQVHDCVAWHLDELFPQFASSWSYPVEVYTHLLKGAEGIAWWGSQEVIAIVDYGADGSVDCTAEEMHHSYEVTSTVALSVTHVLLSNSTYGTWGQGEFYAADGVPSCLAPGSIFQGYPVRSALASSK